MEMKRLIILIALFGLQGTFAKIVTGPALMWTAMYNTYFSKILVIRDDSQTIYTNASYGFPVTATELLSNIGAIKTAIAVDYEDELAFWADPGYKKINKASFDTGSGDTIYEGISANTEGITVDWVAKKLYWTDASYNWIMVSDYGGDHVHVLIYTGLDRPQGIAAHPARGHLYWCDRGSVSKIERSNLNGDQRRVIVSEETDGDKISGPNGLTIDYQENRLYWTDVFLKKVMVVDLNTDAYSVREVFEENSFIYPFDIALDQYVMFITDFASNQFWIVDRTNTENRYPLEFPGSKPISLALYASWSQQPETSSCSVLNGGCHQLCVGDPGGHKCLCKDGFLLDTDQRSCVTDTHLVPGHQLLFTTSDSLCRLQVDFAHAEWPVSEYCFISGIEAGAMDFDFYQDKLYFHDKQSKYIRRMTLRENPTYEDILMSNHTVTGISIDWLASNMYWTEVESKAIYISKLDGSYKTRLVSDNVDHLQGIAVHPDEKLLFWADSGSPPRIEKSALSGYHRSYFVSTDLTTPTALTIDFNNNRLYWVDLGMQRIESINTDGDQREILTTIQYDVFSITIFQDHLFWTEQDNIVDYSHVQDKRIQVFRTGSSPDTIVAFDKSKQVLTPGPCDILNGGCDEICAPSAFGAECVCSQSASQSCSVVIRCPLEFFSGSMTASCVNTPGNSCRFKCDDYFVATTVDTPSCQDNGEWNMDTSTLCKLDITLDHFLLVGDTQRNTGKIFLINLLSPTLAYVPLPLSDVVSPIALDYDYVEGKVYWTDVEKNTINRASLDGSHQEVIADTQVEAPDGLAIDVVGRRLYWTDADFDRIETSNLDGSDRLVLLSSDLEKPRAILVESENSRLFWSDWGTSPKIEQSKLDGEGRRVLVDSGLGWPNGLALDKQDQRLFWCDASIDVIEYIDLQTRVRVTLIDLADSTSHPFGLTLTDDFIYWTDWNSDRLQRADKATGRNVVSVGHAIFGRPNDIHVFTAAETTAQPSTTATLSAKTDVTFSTPVDIGTTTPSVADNGAPAAPQGSSNIALIGGAGGGAALIIIVILVLIAVCCFRRNTETPESGPSPTEPIYCDLNDQYELGNGVVNPKYFPDPQTVDLNVQRNDARYTVQGVHQANRITTAHRQPLQHLWWSGPCHHHHRRT
ncbi:low-density lipoprotein receptor-related protein 4-like [Ptychodera flava]|uniref:low-density lipoprotein receptor-related protein 4-like n=1 Tax=Ptychodera flava TaxID=63121 RepID=UPI00396A13D7